MTERNDPMLERHAKRLLDDAANDLDADTLARLRAARARAWQRAAAEPRPRPRRRWLALGGLAVAGLVLAVAGTLWSVLPGSDPLGGLEDADLLASKESPEFYAEIDFYQWLAQRDVQGSTSPGARGDYRDVGGRATPGAVAESAFAPRGNDVG